MFRVDRASHATTDDPPPATGFRATLATLATWEATLVLAGLPFAMVVANRSSILFLAVAAFFAIQVVLFERRFGALAARLWRRTMSPLGVTALAFLAWALASTAWSHAPEDSLFAFGEFILPVAAAVAVALALPPSAPRAAILCLAAGLAAAAALILYELATDLSLRKSFGIAAHPVIFNRSILTLTVLTLPALWWLWSARRRGLAVLLAAVVAFAVGFGESGASVFALAIGLTTFVMASLARRLTAVLVAGAMVGGLALAPLIGDAAHDVLPAEMHSQMATAHSRERVEIWQAYGAAVRKAPWLGVGFGMSARYGETDQARWLGPERQLVLTAFHPHNLAIQVWAELGAVGAILVLALLLFVLALIVQAGGPALPARLAAFATVAAVSLVAHGAWQGWWAAAVGAMTVWFTVAAYRPTSALSMPTANAYPSSNSARPVWADIGYDEPR